MKKTSKSSVIVLLCTVLFSIVLPLAKAEAAAAKPEGTLTIAQYTLAEEPFLTDRSSGAPGALWECVYDYLIYGNTLTLKPIPGAAERWDYSKDYRDLTFRLRKGIQFQDGWGELTAEDVKWTIEFNARPASLNARASDLKNIRSIDVVDRYTVTIHLKEPDPTFWLMFCNLDNPSMPVLCKKYVETVGEEKANRQPIGSGPYRLLEHKIGDYAKFEAVEKHWLLVPEFKYLVLRVVPEETTRLAMLQTGEIDIAYDLAIDKVAELEKRGLRPVVSQNSGSIFFPFGGMLLPEDKRYVETYHRKDPWKDIRVREAMNIAIDRNAIVKNLYAGLATPAPIFWTLPGWEKLDPIPYDPKRAKQLLAEGGFPNGFGFKLYTYERTPQMPFVAQAAAGYWEAIGLKSEIVKGDYAAWRSVTNAGKTAGYVWTDNMSNYIDYSTRIAAYELPGGVRPWWQSEETKVAIKKALPETDPQKREAYFKDLARVYRSIYSHIPIVYYPTAHGVGKKVGEWHPSPVGVPRNYIFARQSKPLNTYRLFTP